jgi:hypothetical protein
MDTTNMCDSKELLVSYLYDEITAGDRTVFERHLSSCRECRDELAGLRGTRGSLELWAPPEPDFGFRIVRGAAAQAARRRWFPSSPIWGLAAAAVLVLAVAAAIARVEVRYDKDGLVVRTGWGAPPAASSAGLVSANPVVSTIDWKTDIGALEQRLRQIEAAAARAQDVSAAGAAGPRMSDAEVMRRVRQMLTESETRQQKDLAVLLTTYARAVDQARRADAALVQGASGAHAATERQMLNMLRVVAQQQK